MDCKRPSKSVKIDERSVKEQEHRRASRLWRRVVQKQSSSMIETGDFGEDDGKKGVSFRGKSPCPSKSDYRIVCPGDLNPPQELTGSALQRKMARMKTFAKRKSPLQKFDEIVKRELTSRHCAEEESSSPFDGSQKWPGMDFPSCRVSTSGRKVSFDTKMSKTTLLNVERELKNKDKDPSDVENAALMEAIEKLVQAQVSCRFDAAVRAVEAAASSVPPEMAEEVAINCAKEYQSEIIDIVNEKVAVGDGRKPMEVIGYIGITKRKGAPDEE